MNIQKVARSLSNETRIKIVRLVAEQPDSAVRIHERYEGTHAEQKHRETIYRGLENLVDAGLLDKEYNGDEGQIEYRLHHERLLIDMVNGTVEARETE